MDTPCDATERLLSNACTTVTMGNGHKAKFWHSSWLQGDAPRMLAPNFYSLVKCKNKSVSHELRNNTSIRSKQERITDATQLEEIIYLWL
jgi:hypothetical protein